MGNFFSTIKSNEISNNYLNFVNNTDNMLIEDVVPTIANHCWQLLFFTNNMKFNIEDFVHLDNLYDLINVIFKITNNEEFLNQLFEINNDRLQHNYTCICELLHKSSRLIKCGKKHNQYYSWLKSYGKTLETHKIFSENFIETKHSDICMSKTYELFSSKFLQYTKWYTINNQNNKRYCNKSLVHVNFVKLCKATKLSDLYDSHIDSQYAKCMYAHETYKNILSSHISICEDIQKLKDNMNNLFFGEINKQTSLDFYRLKSLYINNKKILKHKCLPIHDIYANGKKIISIAHTIDLIDHARQQHEMIYCVLHASIESQD